MGTADVQDADIPATGQHKGVQLAQEQVKIGRSATRKLKGVPLDMGIGHRRNPAMEQVLGPCRQEDSGQGDEEDQAFHLSFHAMFDRVGREGLPQVIEIVIRKKGPG